jgi:hypothetical protein
VAEYIRRAQVKLGLINLCKGLFSLNAHVYYKLKSGTYCYTYSHLYTTVESMCYTDSHLCTTVDSMFYTDIVTYVPL